MAMATRGTGASLSIQDHQDGGLNVTCFAGCDRQTIIVALEQATGLTIWQAWASTGAAQGRFSALQVSST